MAQEEAMFFYDTCMQEMRQNMVKRALEEVSAAVHLLPCAASVCLAALLASSGTLKNFRKW